jgi:hypothetical protein
LRRKLAATDEREELTMPNEAIFEASARLSVR